MATPKDKVMGTMSNMQGSMIGGLRKGLKKIGEQVSAFVQLPRARQVAADADEQARDVENRRRAQTTGSIYNQFGNKTSASSTSSTSSPGSTARTNKPYKGKF